MTMNFIEKFGKGAVIAAAVSAGLVLMCVVGFICF